MIKILKWFISANTQSKFLAISAAIAAILLLDPLRSKRESATATLAPPETSPPSEILSPPTEETLPGEKLHALPIEQSTQPAVRTRIAYLLQHIRRPEGSSEREQDTPIVTDAQAAQLMMAADRFMCTTEMATLLAVMHVGGPERLLYWDDTWDAATSRAVYRLHTHITQGCKDDIELALKLYTAWSETSYQGQSLLPAWAIRAAWQPYRIPALPTALEEALGEALFPFKKAIRTVLDAESFDHLVERYGIKKQAGSWLTEAKTAFQQARREAWARAFFVHHELLLHGVELQRERLLSELTVNKKIAERRPLNFDLLERVRILFAHYMVQQSPYGPLLPRVIAVQPEWKEWLQQAERTPLALARFIAQHTPRDRNGELTPTFTDARLFIEQRLPYGSRYLGTVTALAPDGTLEIAFGRRVSDAPPIREMFRGEPAMLNSDVLYTPLSETERKESIEEALHAPQAPQSTTLTYRREMARTPGILRTGAEVDNNTNIYSVNDPLLVEVVDYDFADSTQPRVIVSPVPEREPFDIFHERYQVGDILTVVVQAYDERPGDMLISLVVREPISQLEMLIDPEHLSFTPLGEAVREIPPGIHLHVVVEEVDTLRRAITLSLLPLMEAHLERLLKAQGHAEGRYEATAIISKVFPESLLLILTWSEPALGLIYALDIARSSLPNPHYACEVGELVQLELTFSDTLSSPPLAHLPTEVKQHLALPQQGLRLFWQQNRLHFNGQMSYFTRNTLLALSNDRVYSHAISSLYRASYQWFTEVTALKAGPASRREAPANAQSSYMPVLENIEPGQAEMEEGDDAPELKELLEGAERLNKETIPLPPALPPILKYNAGDIVQGHVKGVLTYGAFVEIEPGVEGLVHRTKMWGHVADVADVISIGDTVNVRILAIKTEDGKLELSMQLPEYDPFRNYQVDDIVTGTVTDIQEFGAFVQIVPGVSGLIHKSKMWGYVEDVEDVVRIGDEVTARILSVNMERRWLELSMQVPEHDPLLRYEVGEIVTGVVTKVEEFGAFVRIEPGATGLVHKNDIRNNLNDARRELSVGDEVDVLIVRIDMERRRMNLSMKDV